MKVKNSLSLKNQHLTNSLQWAINTKTQQEINLERQDYRQVLLYDRLKNAIIKVNPEIDDDGIDDALEQIKEDTFSSNWDVMDTNERIRAKLVGLSRSGGLEPITVTQNYGEGNENKTVYLYNKHLQFLMRRMSTMS